MPKKQQSSDKGRRAGRSKANLGQKEAELQKTSKEELRHMGGGEASKTAQPPTGKHRTK
jgi:hypothetical protein